MMMMKTFLTALAAATLVAGIATQASAAPNGRDRNGAPGYREHSPCVVTGWTDWPTTHPNFKCPDEDAPANTHRQR